MLVFLGIIRVVPAGVGGGVLCPPVHGCFSVSIESTPKVYNYFPECSKKNKAFQ